MRTAITAAAVVSGAIVGTATYLWGFFDGWKECEEVEQEAREYERYVTTTYLGPRTFLRPRKAVKRKVAKKVAKKRPSKKVAKKASR